MKNLETKKLKCSSCGETKEFNKENFRINIGSRRCVVCLKEERIKKEEKQEKDFEELEKKGIKKNKKCTSCNKEKIYNRINFRIKHLGNTCRLCLLRRHKKYVKKSKLKKNLVFLKLENRKYESNSEELYCKTLIFYKDSITDMSHATSILNKIHFLNKTYSKTIINKYFKKNADTI